MHQENGACVAFPFRKILCFPPFLYHFGRTQCQQLQLSNVDTGRYGGNLLLLIHKNNNLYIGLIDEDFYYNRYDGFYWNISPKTRTARTEKAGGKILMIVKSQYTPDF